MVSGNRLRRAGCYWFDVNSRDKVIDCFMGEGCCCRVEFARIWHMLVDYITGNIRIYIAICYDIHTTRRVYGILRSIASYVINQFVYRQ